MVRVEKLEPRFPTIEDYLGDYKKEILPLAEQFFREQKEQISHPEWEVMLRYQEQALGRGKGIRGALMKLSYKCFGGKDTEQILLASLAIEIMHRSFLILDDGIDKSLLRWNESTVYQQAIQNLPPDFPDKEHFGTAVSSLIAGLGQPLAQTILSRINFSGEPKKRAEEIFYRAVLETILGERLDIQPIPLAELTAEDVFLTHRFKTASYTLVRPLQMGAVLAGADEEELEILEKFGLPLGVAYQIKDDILGMFDEKTVLGKPVGSDLREGKKTLLMVKAWEKGNKEQKDFLKYTYGNPSLTPEEIEVVREIIRETGSLGYSQEQAKNLVEEGKNFIPEITPDPFYQGLFSQMADFVAKREF